MNGYRVAYSVKKADSDDYTNICPVCACRHGHGNPGPRTLVFVPCEKHDSNVKSYFGRPSAAATEKAKAKSERLSKREAMGKAGGTNRKR
jgi:hypothetical protein